MKPVVFLGWEPHPMNANFKLTYLSGGDDIFGPNFGGATVYTNLRAGYTTECPNVGKLLTNLKFSLPMENEIMGKILERRQGAGRGRDGMDQGQSGRHRTLARRRHDQGWRAKDCRPSKQPSVSDRRR